MYGLITYIFRNPSPAFFSIEEVFSTVIPEVAKHLPVSRMELPFPSGFWGVLKNLASFRKEKKRLYHITGQEYYMAMCTGRNTVLTIHDVGSAFSGKWLRDTLVLFFWFWLPALIARRITVISEFSRGELVKLVPFAARKIRVIHNPLNPALEYRPKPFDAERPVILLMGTKPNKNLERIITALKDIPCRLVIVGKLSSEQLTLLNKSGFDRDPDPLPPEGCDCSVATEFKSPLGDIGVNSAICQPQSEFRNPQSAVPDNSGKPSSTITEYRLPNTDYRIPITGSMPHAPCSKLHAIKPDTEYRLPITDYRLPNTFSSYHNLLYKEILALYRECDLLCFASTYEGFGLPILEAQATGRPVVTSAVASMPEVAGEGACLVDPFSVDAIRKGVLRVIRDTCFREELVRNGLKNTERFSPEKIAADYLRVYRDLSRK